MMGAIEEIPTLVAADASPAVSMFMPTHIAGREIRQDSVRLRRLIDGAVDQLVARGSRRPEAEKLLAPARQLLGDGEFWRHQDRGLAVFAAPGVFRAIRVPLDLVEKVSVGPRFLMKPLLPLLEAPSRFLVVAISARQASVFEADLSAMAERSELRLAAGTGEVAAESIYEETRQRNPGGASGGLPKSQPLGNAPEEERKDQLIEYLRRAAAALQERVSGDGRPIVLAATPEIRGHFQKLSALAQLLPQALDVNPEALDAGELHRRARDLVRPIFAASRASAEERLHQLLGEKDARATVDPSAIVAAAHDGRIDTLFLAEGAELWGRYDEGAHRIVAHEGREAEDDDLLDDAAAQTLRQRGDVVLTAREKLPGDRLAAALLRY